MNLGISTYTFPWNVGVAQNIPAHPLSYKKMLQYAVENRIGYFQFGDNYPLHQFSKNELELLKETALDSNIQLQAGTRRLTEEHIIAYIAIARKLQSPFLRVVIDDEGFHPSVTEIIETLKKLLPHLRDNNIILAIENHDRFKAQTLAHIVEATDTELIGICLDTANSLGAGEGIAAIAPVLLPYTVNLHIKDFTINRVPHKMGFTVQGAPAGDGMLDIPWLLNLCKPYKRCGTATLEIWMNEADTLQATLQKEKEWVEKSIYYLKQYI